MTSWEAIIDKLGDKVPSRPGARPAGAGAGAAVALDGQAMGWLEPEEVAEREEEEPEGAAPKVPNVDMWARPGVRLPVLLSCHTLQKKKQADMQY